MISKRVRDNIGGNLYNKYASKNPVVKILIKKFFIDFDAFFDLINVSDVLDVGCGEGYVTNHIKEYRNEIHIEGVDYSPEIIKKAIRLNPRIKFTEGSIYDLKYNDNTFDLSVASEVLEHLEEPEKGIVELKRVSKKYCIITVPNEPFFRIANLFRLKYLSTLGNTPGHVQNWTRKDFRRLLDNNFSNVSIKISTLWQIALCEI